MAGCSSVSGLEVEAGSEVDGAKPPQMVLIRVEEKKKQMVLWCDSCCEHVQAFSSARGKMARRVRTEEERKGERRRCSREGRVPNRKANVEVQRWAVETTSTSDKQEDKKRFHSTQDERLAQALAAPSDRAAEAYLASFCGPTCVARPSLPFCSSLLSPRVSPQSRTVFGKLDGCSAKDQRSHRSRFGAQKRRIIAKEESIKSSAGNNHSCSEKSRG